MDKIRFILGGALVLQGIFLLLQHQAYSQLQLEYQTLNHNHRELLEDCSRLNELVHKLQRELKRMEFNASIWQHRYQMLSRKYEDLEREYNKQLDRMSRSLELSPEMYKAFLEFLVGRNSQANHVPTPNLRFERSSYPGLYYYLQEPIIVVDIDLVFKSINHSAYKYSPIWITFHELAHEIQHHTNQPLDEDEANKFAERCTLRFMQTGNPICHWSDRGLH